MPIPKTLFRKRRGQVDPASIGAVIGAIASQVASNVANIVTGIKQGMDLLVLLTTLVMIANLVALATGVEAKGVPTFSFTGDSIVGTYLAGYPDCKASAGPMEACILPSKNLILAIPNAVLSVGTAGQQAADNLNMDPKSVVQQSPLQFFSALLSGFFGLLLAFLTIPFLAAKVMVSFGALKGVNDFYLSYARHFDPSA